MLLMQFAAKPTMQTLSAGIEPAQTGKITAALDAQGVTYEIGNGGTSIQVPQADLARARIALAEKGLSSGGATQPGFELLDKQKLGASDFQQKVAYQRALEGQIASTIGQVSGVSGATVQLTLPDDQLFADEEKPATAAVLLGGGPTTLEAGAVRGIANLVASSVEGLKTENVTITDGSGQLLWPQGDGAAGAGTMSKPSAEARYDAALAGQLGAIIDRTVGTGKAQVQVQSDLNVDAIEREQLAYDRRSVPLETDTESERLRGTGGGGAGGAAGAAANIPTYAAGAGGGGGGNSNYNRSKDNTKFGVGKTVTRTKVAPGAVNRLDVALVIDPSVPATTRSQLEQAIGTAAGIDRQRGDTIRTSVVPFAKTASTSGPAAGPAGNVIGYAKWAGLALASLLFLFFVTRSLRKRENADLLGEPVWLRQIESPRPVAELAGEAPTMVLNAAASRRQQVEHVVQNEPERVAQALRAWMAEEDR
jgi:flagellar M-ring protein FliF